MAPRHPSLGPVRLSRPVVGVRRPGSASAASPAPCPCPRYMCTPHGRHGSKLRTVRMMSMPLKCSRSFSSKIGVSLHRVLVRARRAVDVARVGVPRRRRVRVVVGDLAAPDHHVVREHAAHRLGEAAADALVGHLERLPRLGAAGADLGERLLDEVQRAGRRVGLEVGARPVALDGVATTAGSSTRTSTSGLSAVFGRLICTLVPVALT